MKELGTAGGGGAGDSWRWRSREQLEVEEQGAAGGQVMSRSKTGANRGSEGSLPHIWPQFPLAQDRWPAKLATKNKTKKNSFNSIIVALPHRRQTKPL